MSALPLRVKGRRPGGRIDTASPLPQNVEPIALPKLAKRAQKAEEVLGELQSKFSQHLSNANALGSLLGDARRDLEMNTRSVDGALDQTVPHIAYYIDKSTQLLAELEETLPVTTSQTVVIQDIYDSGRMTARQLLGELEWLNLDWWERWRRIIFTASSPVSWRWKAAMRVLFCVLFVAFTWLTYIALGGAYRAHRHRLVWGEKLIS